MDWECDEPTEYRASGPPPGWVKFVELAKRAIQDA